MQHIENGDITLIAATTENPYFYVYPAVLSRRFVFEFKAVTAAEAKEAVRKASLFWRRRGESYSIEDGVIEHIAAASGGDVRRAVNSPRWRLCPLCRIKRTRSIRVSALTAYSGF